MPGIGIAVSPCLGSFVPDQILLLPGLVYDFDPNRADRRWQDTGKTTPAILADTMAVLQDSVAGTAEFNQGTGANEPTLTAWDAQNMGIFMADATDQLAGNASVLAASNGVAGWTEYFVIELPPALGATFQFIRMTTNAGNTKFQVYMDASNKFGLHTRRVNGDATSNIGFGTIASTGGGRYIVIASVDYSTAAGVCEVNGDITGLGISGTFAWATGAACEALNAGAHLISGASPATLASFGRHGFLNRAVTSDERAAIRNALNARWAVF